MRSSESIDQPLYFASAWDEDRLVGLAIVIVEEYARQRRLLTINFPGTHHVAHARGLWIARDVDGGAVLRALLEAVLAGREALGASRVSIQQVPAADPLVPDVARALGFVPLEAPPDFHIAPIGERGFAAHLDRLLHNGRRKLKRDLARPGQGSARASRSIAPIPPELRRELWPLQLDTFARKEARLRFRPEGLFAALARHLAPDDAVATVCRRAGRLIGFVLHYRAGELVRCPYVGHVADPPLHVYAAMLTHLLRAELDRGARAILLGYGGNAYKSRIGAEAVPQISLYRGA